MPGFTLNAAQNWKLPSPRSVVSPMARTTSPTAFARPKSRCGTFADKNSRGDSLTMSHTSATAASDRAGPRLNSAQPISARPASSVRSDSSAAAASATSTYSSNGFVLTRVDCTSKPAASSAFCAAALKSCAARTCSTHFASSPRASVIPVVTVRTLSSGVADIAAARSGSSEIVVWRRRVGVGVSVSSARRPRRCCRSRRRSRCCAFTGFTVFSLECTSRVARSHLFGVAALSEPTLTAQVKLNRLFFHRRASSTYSA